MLLIVVYLVYGAAFLTTAALLAAQALGPTQLVPRRALWLLFGFAIAHGASEWLRMILFIAERSLWHAAAWIPDASLALLGGSFVLLLGAAAELCLWRGRLARALRATSLVMLIACASFTIIRVAADGSFAIDEALIRYTAGTSGPLLAAAAMWCFAHMSTAMPGPTAATRRWLKRSAIALVLYALVAGLLVPRTTFFPASVINADLFRALTHLPIETIRAACALIAGVALTYAFVVQGNLDRAEWERQREGYFAAVAHDLRNPVTTLSLGVELLDGSIRADDLASRKVLGRMASSTRLLDRMISDLLDQSRIAARQLTLERAEVDLSQLIPAVLERAVDVTSAQTVVLRLPRSLPRVNADAARVEQVLVNLLSNAAKYSVASSEIVVDVAPGAEDVAISVTNHGPGITADDTRQLFEGFYRTPAAAGSKVPGLGLGLYISRGIIEAHGGTIRVESEPGKTTTFRFTLPLAGQERARPERTNVAPVPRNVPA